jgi:dihydroflavonol-4-reductase
MRALVTGASGFVGVHLTRLLRERGDEVRCLVRPSSRRAPLDGLGVAFHVGDLADRRVLRQAIDGCDVVFHCAADYRFQAAARDEIYRNNVTGSENLFAAADEVGVGRVVYTSSVATLGLSSDGSAASETAPSTLGSMIGAYKRSKFLAERVADSFVAMRKSPIVIVNPSTPVGEDDARPTPTGQFLVDFLSGRIPAYVDTGLNIIDVRDVAEGHLLAAERGVVGERYILGHRNVTLAELLDLLAHIAGVRWARVRLPHIVPLLAAMIEAPLARLRRRPPRVSLEAVRLARKKMFFDPGKAVRELGLPQSPIESALARAVAWFRAQGYVPS